MTEKLVKRDFPWKMDLNCYIYILHPPTTQSGVNAINLAYIALSLSCRPLPFDEKAKTETKTNTKTIMEV